MLDHYLRGTKDVVLGMMARPLHPLHPNYITLLSFFWGATAVILLAYQFYAPALVCWWLNRLFDGLDGTLARQNRKQSDLGGYLDILVDFSIYAAIPLGLTVGMASPAAFVSLAFLLASFYVNAASWMYLAAILEKRRQGTKHNGELTTVTMPPGLIGGAETIIFYSVFIIWPAQMVSLFVLMGVLVLFTVGQRLVWAVRHLD